MEKTTPLRLARRANIRRGLVGRCVGKNKRLTRAVAFLSDLLEYYFPSVVLLACFDDLRKQNEHLTAAVIHVLVVKAVWGAISSASPARMNCGNIYISDTERMDYSRHPLPKPKTEGNVDQK